MLRRVGHCVSVSSACHTARFRVEERLNMLKRVRTCVSVGSACHTARLRVEERLRRLDESWNQH